MQADEPEDACIYETYKAKYVEGRPHPDDIVETASLNAVDLPVPTYQHHLGPLALERLSAAQVEAVVYANMRFKQKVEDGGSFSPSLIFCFKI